MEPSTEWKQQMDRMEKYFKKFHREEFSVKHKIIAKTTKYILKKAENSIPKKLVFSFVKNRIFIRLKFLNCKRDEAKRKRKSSSCQNVPKKIRKIVN